jgi:hypothetical protein
LTGRLSKQIPQCDIDPADRMSDRSSAPKPEHVLMQLFAHPLRLQRSFAIGQRTEDIQGSLDESIVGKDAPQTDLPCVGMDCDQRVDAVLWTQLIAPATLWGCTAQAGACDFSDLHRWFKCILKRLLMDKIQVIQGF